MDRTYVILNFLEGGVRVADFMIRAVSKEKNHVKTKNTSVFQRFHCTLNAIHQSSIRPSKCPTSLDPLFSLFDMPRRTSHQKRANYLLKFYLRHRDRQLKWRARYLREGRDELFSRPLFPETLLDSLNFIPPQRWLGQRWGSEPGCSVSWASILGSGWHGSESPGSVVGLT